MDKEKITSETVSSTHEKQVEKWITVQSSLAGPVPGATRVPGNGLSQPSRTTSAAFDTADESSGVARVVAISNEELVSELRDQVLQNAAFATNVERVNPRRPIFTAGILGVVAVILGCLVVVSVLVVTRKDEQQVPVAINDGNISLTEVPPEELQKDWSEHGLYQLISSRMEDGGEALKDPESPYYKVFERMVEGIPPDTSGSEHYVRYVLQVFYESTRGDEWTVNTNWLSKKKTCLWYGVVCADELRLRALQINAGGKQEGSSDLGVGRFKRLELPNNNLQGPIIPELGRINWDVVDLSNNQLTGTLPHRLEALVDFFLIDLSGNPRLGGQVPEELCERSGEREIRVDCKVVSCSCCQPPC